MICPEEVPILDETTIEQHLKLKSFVDLEQIKLSILKQKVTYSIVSDTFSLRLGQTSSVSKKRIFQKYPSDESFEISVEDNSINLKFHHQYNSEGDNKFSNDTLIENISINMKNYPSPRIFFSRTFRNFFDTSKSMKFEQQGKWE